MKESLLTILRDEKTSVEQFRQVSHQLASLLAAEASAWVAEQSKTVQTPLGKASGKAVHQRVVLIPILRAGMALLPAFLSYFPQAPIGFFGIRRDEATAQPQLYYEKIPPLRPSDLIILLDPMVATAGSALLAIEHLLAKGASQLSLVGVIGAQEGVKKIQRQHPSLKLLLAAVDPELNPSKFIVPGLGDFGDRYFSN